MQFLNPIWLLALSALSIPVIIHLWNIKPGKTLKVGSISLITAAAQKSSRSFKLHDIWLLIIRCLLLALVTLLLAGPVWVQTEKAAKAKGWLLIPREHLKEAYSKAKNQIDSLTNAGYEFHFFNKDFKKADLKRSLADTTKLHPEKVQANYWSLIQRLDEQMPGVMPVYVITPNNINYFRGEKPSVSLKLQWQTYIPADSITTWIEKAWFTPDDEIYVMQGNSKPSGTYFTKHTVRSGGDSNFITEVINGTVTIKLRQAGDAVNVDTATNRFAIYTDKYQTDATYLKAALQTVADFGRHKYIIKQYSNAAQIPAGEDWLFWLSDQPVNNKLVSKTNHLFSYAAGKITDVNSRIKTTGQYSVNQEPDIALFKEVQAEAEKNTAIWTDGFGKPLLSAQNNNYRFYTHFNPAWNDMVWNDAFPKLLLKLIAEEKSDVNTSKYDRRILDKQQLLPDVVNPTKPAINDSMIKETDLSRYCWLAIALLFFLERWLAHRKKKEVKNG